MVLSSRASCAPNRRGVALFAAALFGATLGAPGAAQQSGLSVAYQYPCKDAGEFFDTSSLQCRACNTVRGAQPLPSRRRAWREGHARCEAVPRARHARASHGPAPAPCM